MNRPGGGSTGEMNLSREKQDVGLLARFVIDARAGAKDLRIPSYKNNWETASAVGDVTGEKGGVASRLAPCPFTLLRLLAAQSREAAQQLFQSVLISIFRQCRLLGGSWRETLTSACTRERFTLDPIPRLFRFPRFAETCRMAEPFLPQGSHSGAIDLLQG